MELPHKKKKKYAKSDLKLSDLEVTEHEIVSHSLPLP